MQTVEHGFDEVTTHELEAELMTWSGHTAAATARLLAQLAAYDRREGWKQWGCKSAAHWLSWKCGESLHTAREKVRVARALEDLPVTAAAFAAGTLSYSKVRAVTRVAVAADDAEWTEIARSSTGAELDRIAAAVRQRLDGDERSAAAAAFEDRSVVARRSGPQGSMKVEGPVDSVDIVLAAVEVIGSQMVDDAVAGSGRDRRSVIDERGGMGAIRFDALVQMAEQILAASPAAAERGDIGRLQLVLDSDAVQEIHDGVEVEGECTLDGHRIAPETAQRWSCDIRASVLLDHHGHCHDEGRDSRTPNRRLRRALHRRDGGMCRFPGCGTTSWLHAHHIVHWTCGGDTDLANLVSLCSFHHHQVHEGGWTVELLDDQVAWTTPDGVPQGIEPLCGDPAAVRRERTGRHEIESRWPNDRLDFPFVVSVLLDHCRRARRRHVPAGTCPASPVPRSETTKSRP